MAGSPFWSMYNRLPLPFDRQHRNAGRVRATRMNRERIMSMAIRFRPANSAVKPPTRHKILAPGRRHTRIPLPTFLRSPSIYARWVANRTRSEQVPEDRRHFRLLRVTHQSRCNPKRPNRSHRQSPDRSLGPPATAGPHRPAGDPARRIDAAGSDCRSAQRTVPLRRRDGSARNRSCRLECGGSMGSPMRSWTWPILRHQRRCRVVNGPAPPLTGMWDPLTRTGLSA